MILSLSTHAYNYVIVMVWAHVQSYVRILKVCVWMLCECVRTWLCTAHIIIWSLKASMSHVHSDKHVYPIAKWQVQTSLLLLCIVTANGWRQFWRLVNSIKVQNKHNDDNLEMQIFPWVWRLHGNCCYNCIIDTMGRSVIKKLNASTKFIPSCILLYTLTHSRMYMCVHVYACLGCVYA